MVNYNQNLPVGKIYRCAEIYLSWSLVGLLAVDYFWHTNIWLMRPHSCRLHLLWLRRILILEKNIFGLDFPLGVQTLLVTLSLMMRKIECAEMCRNAAHVLQLCWNNFRLTEICMNMQHIYSTIAAHVLYTDSTCIPYIQHI